MGERLKANHDLLTLRTTAEDLLQNLGATDEEACARVKASFEKIAGLDAEGTRFRDSEEQDGTPSTRGEAINLDVLAEVVNGVLDALDAERSRVDDEGESERERSAEKAANEWLASLTDFEREAYLEEEEEIWQAWMWAAQKD